MRSNSAVVAEELFFYSSLCSLLQSKGHQSKPATTHLILTPSTTYLNVLKNYVDEKVETLPSDPVCQTATDTKVHSRVPEAFAGNNKDKFIFNSQLSGTLDEVTENSSKLFKICK